MIGGPGRSTSENGMYNQYTSGSVPELIAGDAYINEETGSLSLISIGLMEEHQDGPMEQVLIGEIPPMQV